MDSVQGMIFARKFLKNNNLTFPSYMTIGMEDSVFRTTCFYLTNNYNIKNEVFYYRNYREDSCFSKRTFYFNANENQVNIFSLIF